jgi:hypothetical protein
MIDSVLQFLTSELNLFLNQKAGTIDVKRILLSSVSSSGTVSIPNKTLGMALMNIEEEKYAKDHRNIFRNTKGDIEARNPDLYINLYVLIYANFNDDGADSSDDYAEGLKQLSWVISFFQARSVFTPDVYPAMTELDSSMERLTAELFSFTFEQMHNFWSLVGASYMPSALYKIGTLTIQENELLPPPGRVETINLKPHSV